jgi:hypothetical protein
MIHSCIFLLVLNDREQGTSYNENLTVFLRIIGEDTALKPDDAR